MQNNIWLTNFLLVLNLFLVGFLFIKKIQKKPDLEKQQIFEEIQKQYEKNFSQTLNSQNQIEQRLSVFNTQLETTFASQSQKTKQEFTELKLNNQENLQNLQTNIQERLEKALANLSEINKTELQKLQENNNKNLESLNKGNQEKLEQINTEVQKRLDENFARNLKSFQEVSNNLGQIQSTAQKMIESTKSVDKLNAIFSRTSSKAFGDFGEKYLESLLNDHLAENSWSKQFQLPFSIDKIDFVIYLGEKTIGIDAKFPATKYQDYLEADQSEKSLKLKEYLQQICQMGTEISKKYYKEPFLDTIMLYLPSDSMYNEVTSNLKVMEFLQKLKISICSPNTMLTQILLIQNFQTKLKINNNAEKIITGLSSIRKNIESFRENFRKLGEKLQQAQSNFYSAEKNLNGVENNILALENSEPPN
jgi:DNA recombination protein RmuC